MNKFRLGDRVRFSAIKNKNGFPIAVAPLGQLRDEIEGTVIELFNESCRVSIDNVDRAPEVNVNNLTHTK